MTNIIIKTIIKITVLDPMLWVMYWNHLCGSGPDNWSVSCLVRVFKLVEEGRLLEKVLNIFLRPSVLPAMKLSEGQRNQKEIRCNVKNIRESVSWNLLGLRKISGEILPIKWELQLFFDSKSKWFWMLILKISAFVQK